MENLQITFMIDGGGVHHETYDPIHLDSLIGWVVANREGREAPSRDEEPLELDLPIDKWYIGGHWGWKASAIFPVDAAGESLRFIRKRIEQSRLQITSDCSFSMAGGEYAAKNMPISIKLMRSMVAYVRGDKPVISNILNDVKYIGKYNSNGVGRVTGIEVEAIDKDYSMVKDGLAMRHLPMLSAESDISTIFKRCRTRPPYWNNHGRIPVCDVGDKYAITTD